MLPPLPQYSPVTTSTSNFLEDLGESPSPPSSSHPISTTISTPIATATPIIIERNLKRKIEIDLNHNDRKRLKKYSENFVQAMDEMKQQVDNKSWRFSCRSVIGRAIDPKAYEVIEKYEHQCLSIAQTFSRHFTYTNAQINNMRIKLEKAENESQRMSDSLVCEICLTNKANACFNPCGHLKYCVSCASRFKRLCPLCRKPIFLIITVYS